MSFVWYSHLKTKQKGAVMIHQKNSNSPMLYLLALILFAFVFANTSISNERKFSYTYESNVLPKRVREIEIWNTSRIARSYFFRRLDQRVEYEIGLGNNLQTAFYLNLTNELKDDNGVTAGGSISRKTNVGFSNEWKYKISDNVADPIGFALYSEFTFYPHETEYEGKLLFDKKIDNTLFALNLVYELENKYDFKNGIEVKSQENIFEIDFGASYSFTHNFSVGLEAVNKNSLLENKINNSVLFLGPSISYSTENFWVVATYLPQVKALKGATSGNLNLNSYERSLARILFAFEL